MMSRALPVHANLDHLKNQAKDLLRELQRQNVGTKLADAQHAIARDYGFASWPKLKAHVESLARQADPAGALVAGPSQGANAGGGGGVAANVIDGPPPNYGFERYTPRARQALFFSRYEASQAGSASIEPEHVLLGLIRAGQGLTSRIFERAHLSLEQARPGVAVVGEKLSSSVEIPFGGETKQILRYATEEADRLLHRDIGIAHLLLGILRDERSAATSILREKGMHLHSVRDDIVHLLNEEPISRDDAT
jgi:hypothetical protein